MDTFDHNFVFYLFKLILYPHNCATDNNTHMHALITDEVREQTVLNVFLLKCST